MKTDFLKQLEKDKQIDPNKLDLECVKQAERFLFYAQKAVQANAETFDAKRRMETTQARLELECRKTPENFGLVKVTESAIDAAVKCASRFIDAQDEYRDAYEIEKMLGIAVSVMEMKKRMLENLITLHGQQYFAGPSVPRDLVADWVEYQEGISENVLKKQKTKIRKRGQ